MKQCPFCAEQIQDDAIKCRFCNEIVVQPKKTKWYFHGSILIWGLLFLGPLWIILLPLVWLNPDSSQTKKILLTVIIVVIAVLLAKVMAFSLGQLKQYYNILQGVY
jgi:formate-dependent nitrite reductase membrane component NrfD